MIDGKDSPAALQTGIYLATDAFSKEAYLSGFESFQWLVQHYPIHPLNWVFHLGIAESLNELHQTDRAAKEYQWIVMNAPEEDIRSSAAQRIGDLYLNRFEYERALASYYHSISRYPEAVKKFPPAHINRAESLYWLGQYDRAEEAFLKFLTDYSSHPEGWRATFRLGEIYARKSGGITRDEARKWFVETVNRYPYSPGATLARIRLLPCGDHGGLDYKGAEKFFQTDVKNFFEIHEKSETVLMKDFPDFKALAHLRTLVAFSQNKEAVDVATNELKNIKNSSIAKKPISQILEREFKKTVYEFLEDGKKIEALNYFQEKTNASGDLMQLSKENSSDLLFKLSQVASDLGLGSIAKRFLENKNRKIAADFRNSSQIDLSEELFSSEKNFTEAKALWINSGVSMEMKIRELLNKIKVESKFSYEKELILGIIDEKHGKHNSSLGHSIRAQMLMPTFSKKINFKEEIRRINYWIASLHIKNGNILAAISLLHVLENEKETPIGHFEENPTVVLGIGPVPDKWTLLMLQGEILTQLGRWGEAAATYSRVVSEKQGGYQAQYEYAHALIKTGNLKQRDKAYLALEEILKSKESENIWKKIASETLANLPKKNEQRNLAKEGIK